MTPEQELALLEATAAGLDDALREAFDEVVRLIQAGTEPREAVGQVMATFSGEMADTMATALSGILGQAVGAAEVMAMEVGAVQLSRKLWAEGLAVSETVEGIVRRHAAGFLDARRLALELFEGYAFRPPDAEPLQFNTSNPRLPKYMREALMPDDAVRAQIARAFAKLQVDGLATGPLRAAYQQVLDALDGIEDAAGAKLLTKRLDVAFYERMRYFASRIARTELHRAYAEAEALRLMADADVEYLQVRRVPGGQPCICTLFSGRDLYGLGPGVYPKAECPRPPFHPFCLPGDALITAAGRIAAVSKRWFDGDLVIVTTASGKRLAATVNHPVLTRRGWVAAGLLDVGGDVIARVDPVAVGGSAIVDNDHQDMPASIAEIADAFLSAGQVAAREVPISAEHFHGDGVGSEVAVIGADRELWDRVDADASEISLDHDLQFADAGSAGLFGDGVAHLGLETSGQTAECGVCGGSVLPALFRGERSHAQGHLLAGGALRDAGAGQPPVDDVAADAELARQIQNGAAGEVFADDVVNVERVKFSGHVYNLETEHGHYTANGIVTHNCQCVTSPRLDLTGKKATPRDPAGDQYFLNRLQPMTAARVMGSQAKRDRVLTGAATPEQVANAGKDVLYHVKTVGQV